MVKTLLRNVKIETGFMKENNRVISTSTELVDLVLNEGKVIEIGKDLTVPADIVIEGNQNLLMPSFREMHIHIDKTYFGGPWKAPAPITKGILTRIEEEEIILPAQLPTALARAENMLEWLVYQGHTHIRSHCNVDPRIGTKHIELTLEALKKFEGKLTYDIVAFPQHGLLRSNAEGLMREAMRKGATLVGGVDPATIDRDIEKSLNLSMDIAVEASAGLDLHIHDGGTLGAFEFSTLAKLTNEANKQGQVTISHALALGDLEGQSLDDMIAVLSEAKIDVTSTVPVSRKTIPIPYLHDNGVPVSLGHDSLRDHWSPFGTGNTLEKLGVLAERFRTIDEYSLSRHWQYASGGITPLDNDGKQAWPKVGDQADFLLIDAVCSAQAIARQRPITQVIHKGTVVSETAKSKSRLIR